VALVAGTARGTPSVVLLPVWDQCGATCCRLTSMSKRLLGVAGAVARGLAQHGRGGDGGTAAGYERRAAERGAQGVRGCQGRQKVLRIAAILAAWGPLSGLYAVSSERCCFARCNEVLNICVSVHGLLLHVIGA